MGLPVAEAENSRSAHRGPRRTLIAAATVAFALVAGFGGGALGARLTAGTSTTPAGHTLTQVTTSPVSATLPVPAGGSVEQVAATLLPTVVSILSTSSNSAIGPGSTTSGSRKVGGRAARGRVVVATCKFGAEAHRP